MGAGGCTGSGVLAGDVATGAVLEPGSGLAPSTDRIALMNSFCVTSFFSCVCSCPFCMTTNVGGLVISQKAARNPASVEPASRRRRTAFWASKLDI